MKKDAKNTMKDEIKPHITIVKYPGQRKGAVNEMYRSL